MDTLTSLVANWPADWIVIGALAAFLALDTLRSGISRTAAFSLSLPATILIFHVSKQAFGLSLLTKDITTSILESALFFAIAVIMYFLARRTLPGGYGLGAGGPIQALAAGVAGAAVIVIAWLSTPALEALWAFGPQVKALFSEGYRFWWVIGAYSALALARG